MNQVPTKIVLKSTTRMSLNDRFSTIHQAPNVQTIRTNMASEHQVSAANRRLAQQLANRPGIPQHQVNQMMYGNTPNPRQNNRGRRGGGQGVSPMHQQQGQMMSNAGGNIKSRLSLPRGRGGNQNNFNNQRGGAFRGGVSNRGMNLNNNNNNNNNNFNSRPTFRGRGGMNRGGNRGGQQFNQATGQYYQVGGGRGARGGASNRGGAGSANNSYSNRGGNRGNTRGGAWGRGGFTRGGRGGRGGAGGRGGGANKEDLDSQLDQYMSKTKSTLDSELDAYMAQS